ncbi:hypothetical protein [Pilimelia columellifera]|uniref:Uncharacterized protein n=1 Tax=Pilimelia columellifera subsp. columellifera TaxID=706583 RepID=A0ABP6AAZ7_9ACTN
MSLHSLLVFHEKAELGSGIVARIALRRQVGRSTVGSLAGVLLVLAAGPAAATEVGLGGRVVTFNGGSLLGLRCASTVDTETVVIQAETTLRVRNRTGHRATLLLDGEPFGEVAKRAVAEVLFHHGPVELSLKPHCVVTSQATVRVQVVEPPAPRPTGSAPPEGTAPAPPGGGPVRPGATPQSPAPTAGDTAPVAVDNPEVVDGRAPVGGPRPSNGGGAGSGGAAVDVPMGDALTRAGRTLPNNPPAEAMAAVDPVVDRGPITLLGLLALICISGVLTGAIRAILAQRSTRTSSM